MRNIDREEGGDSVRFPNGFLWGTSVAAYQVEGGNDAWSDWGDWKVRAGKACDFWNRYAEYLDLAKTLGTNSFRFSLEWARIEPQEGRWNEEALEHYRKMINACRSRGLEPFVTLWHFTLPKWIAAKGGWQNPCTVSYFLRFVRRAAVEFGDVVKYWIVINEPSVVLQDGYIRGVFPPGYRFAFRKYFAARSNLKSSLIHAAKILHEISPDSIVGSAFNIGVVEAARSWDPADRLVAWIARKLDDREFVASVAKSLDFIGLNYYMKLRLRAYLFPPSVAPYVPPDATVSDLGWEVYPEGLEEVLGDLWKRFHKPLIVTENGIADAADKIRPLFITKHIEALERAWASGVDVRGYFHWSLIDNFEWAHGFGPRFGLYSMDYEKMKPHQRESSRLYAELIKKYS